MEEKRDVATIRLRPRTHINVHNSVQSSRNHFPIGKIASGSCMFVSVSLSCD